MAAKINRLSRQKSIMSINEGNPLEAGGHVEQIQVKVENLSDCVDIGPAEMTSLLNQLNAKENNEERLQLLDQFKVPYLFTSENLVKILDVTPSVKTRIAMIQAIGPRLKDPGAKKAYFVALFRYAEEKEVVEEVLKVRTKEISAALFKVDNKSAAGGGAGRGVGAGRGGGLLAAGGRGGRGGAGRGPGNGPPAAASAGASSAGSVSAVTPPAATTPAAAVPSLAVPPPTTTSLAGIFSSAESTSGKKSPKATFSDDSLGGSGKMSHTPDVKRLPSIDESPDVGQPVTEGVDDVFAMLDDIDANNESKHKKVAGYPLNRRSYSREDDLLGTIQEMSEDEDGRSLTGTPFSDMNSSTASLAYSLSSTSTQSMIRHDSNGFNQYSHVHHQPGMEKVPRSPRTVSPSTGSPPLKTHSGGSMGRSESPHRAHSPNHSANLRARPPHAKHEEAYSASHHSPVNQTSSSTSPPNNDRIETVAPTAIPAAQQPAPIVVKPSATTPVAAAAAPTGATIADSTLTLRDMGTSLTDRTPAPSSGFSPSSTLAVANNETPRSSDRAAELRRLHLTPSRTSGLGSPLTSPASTARKTLNANAAAAATAAATPSAAAAQVPVTPAAPTQEGGQISRVLFTVAEEGPASPVPAAAPVTAALVVVEQSAPVAAVAPAVQELKIDPEASPIPTAAPPALSPPVKSAIKVTSDPEMVKISGTLAEATASNTASNGSSNGHSVSTSAAVDSAPKPVTPRNTVKFAPDISSKLDDERSTPKASKLEIVPPSTPSTTSASSGASGGASPTSRTPNGSSSSNGTTTPAAVSPMGRKSITPQLVPFSPVNQDVLAQAETDRAAEEAAAVAPTIVGTSESLRSESPPKPVDIKALRNTFTKKGGAVPMPAPPVSSPSVSKPVSKWTPVNTKAPTVAGASQPSRRHSSVTLPEPSKVEATPSKPLATSNPTTPLASNTMGVPFLSPRLAPVPFNPSPITSQSSVGASGFSAHTLHHAASNPQLTKQSSLSSNDGMHHSTSTGSIPVRPALTRRHSDFSVGSLTAAGGNVGGSVLSTTATVAPGSDLATKCAAVLKMDKNSFLELEKEDGWEGMENGQMVMFYSYQELIRRNYYKDYSDNLIKSEMEKYLCDVEFAMVFDKPKDLFYAQPRWKQMDQKKKAMLF